MTVSGLGGGGGTPPTDTCGETLTADGTTNGTWAAGCDSAVSGRGHARYYTFTLAQQSNVTIDLESSIDTYLYLRDGEARSGAFRLENDDIVSGNTNSQIAATALPAGTYTIEATTYDTGKTGSFTLTVSGLSGGSVAGDRAALVALYNSTDGANWTNNSGWLSDNPIGQWHGVTTNDSGRVTGLSLRDNQLSGAVPTELGNLASLESLYLDQNQLGGAIPSELGNLASLTSLDLGENQLTGAIPTELGRLTNLQVLRLDRSQLSGEIPAELGDLTSLTVLYLSYNQLTGAIPTELGSLANMTLMTLSNNRLTGEIPAALGSLTSLTGLSLSANQLGGAIPSELGNLSRLTILSLHSNQLSGQIPAALGKLTGLTYLALQNNQLSGAIPSELGNLTNLETLRVSSNQLTGCVPAGLRDVRDNDFDELGLPFCGS